MSTHDILSRHVAHWSLLHVDLWADHLLLARELSVVQGGLLVVVHVLVEVVQDVCSRPIVLLVGNVVRLLLNVWLLSICPFKRETFLKCLVELVVPVSHGNLIDSSIVVPVLVTGGRCELDLGTWWLFPLSLVTHSALNLLGTSAVIHRARLLQVVCGRLTHRCNLARVTSINPSSKIGRLSKHDLRQIWSFDLGLTTLHLELILHFLVFGVGVNLP